MQRKKQGVEPQLITYPDPVEWPYALDSENYMVQLWLSLGRSQLP